MQYLNSDDCFERLDIQLSKLSREEKALNAINHRRWSSYPVGIGFICWLIIEQEHNVELANLN